MTQKVYSGGDSNSAGAFSTPFEICLLTLWCAVDTFGEIETHRRRIWAGGRAEGRRRAAPTARPPGCYKSHRRSGT